MRRPSAVDVRPTTTRRSAATVGLAVLGLVGLLATLVVGAPPAAAHDTLLSTDPADGAELEAPPEEIVLTFSADQLDVGAAVVVEDEAGTDHADGEAVVDGPHVRQAVDPDLPAGTYTVRWRSVSSDGHTLDGELSFTLTGGAAAASPDTDGSEGSEGAEEPTDPADPTAEPSAEPSTEPATEPATEPTAEATAAADDASADDASAGTPVWLWVLLGVAAVGGVVTALVRRDAR